jgi:hypothetical protein
LKSLSDIKEDMSTLYDELRSGKVELKLAAELANIAGKNLKAEQMELAKAIFLQGHAGNVTPTFPAAQQLLASGEKKQKVVTG